VELKLNKEEKTIFDKMREYLTEQSRLRRGDSEYKSIGDVIRSQEDLMSILPYVHRNVGTSERGIPEDVLVSKRINQSPSSIATPILSILLSTPTAMQARAEEGRSHVWHVMGTAAGGKTMNLTNLSKLTTGLYILSVLGHDRGIDFETLGTFAGGIAKASVAPLQEEVGADVD